MTSKAIALPRVSLVAALLASGYAYAEVCFYEHEDFRGGRKCVDQDVEDLHGIGINDSISSLKLHGDIEVVLYEDSRFRGRSEVYDRDARWLDNLDDRVTSLKIRRHEHHAGWGRSQENGWDDSGRHSRGRICLYRDSHYQGQEVCVDTNVADFSRLNFDNQADSVRIEGDLEAILYEHHHYRGFSRTFTKDTPEFRRQDHDQFSSIRLQHR